MSQNAMPACLCSGAIQAQPEFLSIMQLKLGVGKIIPNSVQINRQNKQHHYQTISKYPLCTSCIQHKCQMATSNKNRRLLVDSDDLFKYVATTPHTFKVPTKVTWLVAPLQFTFIKIKSAQISHVPESSHFQESRIHLQSSTAAATIMAHTFRAATKVDRISIHSLICSAFSTMIPMPHNLSPHFTQFVMLQGYSCSPIAMIRQQQSQFKKSSHRGLYHFSRAVVNSSTRMAKPTMQVRCKERSLTHTIEKQLTILVEIHLKQLLTQNPGQDTK
jgi:hypothetical protein